MRSRKLNILVLFDVPYTPPNGEPYERFMRGAEWKDERQVIQGLQKLGHDVDVFGIFDDIFPLMERLRQNRPDVVFNMTESFRDDRAHESHIAALLDLLAIPYTGAKAEALQICKDKGLTKKLLTYHNIRVPGFIVSHRAHPRRRLDQELHFPVICKPLDKESSEGLAQSSLAYNEADCLERLRYVHERLDSDAIIEEYIDGRELYVGVFGNERLTVLPPQELYFKRLPQNVPRFLTYKAKWDETYRKRYGIDSQQARRFSDKDLEQLNETCKTIYRTCKLSGYARIDLRQNAKGELVFLEANPNPSIKRHDDFAASARRAGIGYEDLLDKIVTLALAS